MLTHDTTPVKVLVVDDYPVACRSLCRSLEREGYHVTSTADAREALILAKQQRPDLVLVDVGLGDGTDGFDVCRELRYSDLTKDITVMMVSGDCKTEDQRKAEAVGAAAFIAKARAKEEVAALRKRATASAKH